MNITCIEIENPYRYRAYCVGKKPMYDIQNFSWQRQESCVNEMPSYI